MNGIRVARVARNVSAIQLASKTKITRSRLSRIERSHVTPRPAELEKIATTLDVSPAWLRNPTAFLPRHPSISRR